MISHNKPKNIFKVRHGPTTTSKQSGADNSHPPVKIEISTPSPMKPNVVPPIPAPEIENYRDSDHPTQAANAETPPPTIPVVSSGSETSSLATKMVSRNKPKSIFKPRRMNGPKTQADKPDVDPTLKIEISTPVKSSPQIEDSDCFYSDNQEQPTAFTTAPTPPTILAASPETSGNCFDSDEKATPVDTNKVDSSLSVPRPTKMVSCPKPRNIFKPNRLNGPAVAKIVDADPTPTLKIETSAPIPEKSNSAPVLPASETDQRDSDFPTCPSPTVKVETDPPQTIPAVSSETSTSVSCYSSEEKTTSCFDQKDFPEVFGPDCSLLDDVNGKSVSATEVVFRDAVRNLNGFYCVGRFNGKYGKIYYTIWFSCNKCETVIVGNDSRDDSQAREAAFVAALKHSSSCRNIRWDDYENRRNNGENRRNGDNRNGHNRRSRSESQEKTTDKNKEKPWLR